VKKSRRSKKALLLLATLVTVTGLSFAASHKSTALKHWYAPAASTGSGGHWSTPHTA